MVSAHDEKLRLMDVLRRHKEHVGSYDGLARKIQDARGTKFDRRKLKDLVEGGDVSLKITELAALDAYLAPFGEGFAANPMFEQSAILAEIVQSMEVTFILGSFPRLTYKRVDISHWDVRSMIEVLRNLNRYGRIRIDIEEVIYRSVAKRRIRAFEDEGWFGISTSERASLVCFGSPRVNRATEVLLAEMFGGAPFVPRTPSDAPLPFGFIWPKDRKNFVSCFELDDPTIARHDPAFARKIAAGDTTTMGLSVGDRLLQVRQGGKRWLSYGIIAAQRRHTGRIWLVLAGVSGASTFGASSAVWTIANAIPSADPGSNSAVLWAVVETTVETDRSLLGDQRIVTAQRIIDGPRVSEIDRT